MKKIGKFLGRGLILIVILALIVAAGGLFYFKSYLPNTVAQKSFPQIDGEIQLDGLDGTVDIYRDQMGIPHIYATTTHDLFFAQGYVHAQDRFWQMDSWRHIGSGTLSEMFGSGQVETDSFLRTLGWKQVAEQEWEQLAPDAQAIALAYTDGVNAYLKDHNDTAVSLGICRLGLAQPGLQNPAVDTGQLADLGQSHGMGLGRQHGRRNRTRHFAQNPHPRTTGGSLS